MLTRRLFLTASAAPLFAGKKPEPPKPNILLIAAENLGAWMLGCYGNKDAATPNIDLLARSGVRFLNCIAAAPVPVPAQPPIASLHYACSDAAGDLGKALALLGQPAQGKPWFLYAGFNGPLAAVDDAVGKLEKGLRDGGLRGNTLVVFAGRNGARQEGQGKSEMGEDLMRVPLLMSWHGRIPPDLVRAEVVAAYDLAPTLLEAAGLPSDAKCGQSYLWLAANRKPGKKQTWPATVFARHGAASMVRDWRYKVVVHAGGAGELYDLREDPRERTNQYENPAFVTVRDRLRKELAAWEKRCG